jgi:hypothetical protein
MVPKSSPNPGMEHQMSSTGKVYAESGKIYFFRESGGTFYVSTTSWFPGGASVGSAESLENALALIVADPDSGGGIDSIQ